MKFLCQREIEHKTKCHEQCANCEKYFNPLEMEEDEKQYIDFLGVKAKGVVKGERFHADDGMIYPLNIKGVELITKEKYRSYR